MKSTTLNFVLAAATLISQAAAHYTFPVFVSGGANSSDWAYVRQTNNFQSLNPVTDVTSADLRCYDSAEPGTAGTITVAAGSTIGFNADGNPPSIYHPGVVNVYMAQAPSGTDASEWDGDGTVWFKVYQITAVTDGGSTITFPAENVPGITFTVPTELPSGQYIIRMEAIALHVASTYGGAQFYIGCANVEVTGGGSGTPGPLVAIPGVYTGYEPGILLDIYYPIPATYTQPGPAVWPASTGAVSVTGSASATKATSTAKVGTTASSVTVSSSAASATASTAGASAAEYAQCGGTGFTGPSSCASPFVCTYSSEYYSQCLPA